MVNGMFAMETMKLCEELMKEGLMECWRVKKLHSFEEEESMEKVEGEVYVLRRIWNTPSTHREIPCFHYRSCFRMFVG